MKNEKFDKAIDEIIDLITTTHEIQMDHLKSTVKAIHELNVSDINPNEVAQQIMNLPVESVQSSKVSFGCAGSVSCGNSYKMTDKDLVVEEGQFGDIWDLTRVQNAGDTQQGFDFYHHCPEMQDDLVRLDYSKDKDEHKCQFCKQVFLSKYPPKGLSG